MCAAPQCRSMRSESEPDVISFTLLIVDSQGLAAHVTCLYGDAYANCFACLPEKVDAMFLDLPKPWYLKR